MLLISGFHHHPDITESISSSHYAAIPLHIRSTMRMPVCKLCSRAARSQRAQLPSSAAAARGFASSALSTQQQPTSSSPAPSSSAAASTSKVPGLSDILTRYTPPSASSSSSFNPFASSSSSSTSSTPIFDPLKLVGDELSTLRGNVQKLLGSGHPALDTIAKYYFQAEGKHIRPLIVLLMSQATNGLAPNFNERRRAEGKTHGQEWKSRINDPLEARAEEILSDVNPSSASLSGSSPDISTSSVLPSQRRLAEITEMIHVASLLHDDVIDTAATRRAQASAPAAFGNKLSILGGDFLLARASLYLSRLGSNEVVELVASVLANLVEGEVMQIKGNTPDKQSNAPQPHNGISKPTPEIFEHYLKKTYLKTASLIAKSARATTILGGCGEKQGWVEGERIKDIAYSYGRNLGIAFQVSRSASEKWRYAP